MLAVTRYGTGILIRAYCPGSQYLNCSLRSMLRALWRWTPKSKAIKTGPATRTTVDRRLSVGLLQPFTDGGREQRLVSAAKRQRLAILQHQLVVTVEQRSHLRDEVDPNHMGSVNPQKL